MQTQLNTPMVWLCQLLIHSCLILLTFRDASEIRPHLQRTHLQQVGGPAFLGKRGKDGRIYLCILQQSKINHCNVIQELVSLRF